MGTPHLPRPLAAPAPRLEAAFGKAPERLLVDLLCGFRNWLWDEVIASRVRRDPHLRLFFSMFDLFVSAAAGIVRDGVLDEGWEAINRYDLCEWLTRHGAKDVTVGVTPAERSPVLRSIYDVAFGYPEGEIAKASIAAGTAMSDLLRLCFAYRGALMYKMQAGMGDTVLAPFYLALRKRGVKFEFFSAVTKLGLGGGDGLGTIEVVRQLDFRKPKAEVPYEPLIDVGGLECWPSEPRWEQLAEGAKLRRKGHDFEHEANPLGRRPETLERGRDFEHAVLAIPVGALGGICAQIAERVPRFGEMLTHSATVSTQAFQLWLGSEPTELGYPHAANSVAGAYTEPLDTWCDMSHLLPREQWTPQDGVAGLAYFCGVLEDRPGEQPAAATERVKVNAEAFLEGSLGPLWPGATVKGGGVDWSLLADPAGASGAARLGAQYWRANITPSERYVLTPADSVRHRLRADESGVDGLVLAGDWTRSGVNGGCVEGAVTSGMQAAQALIGTSRELPGENQRWLSERHTGPLARPPRRAPAAAPLASAAGRRPAPRGPAAAGPEYVEYGARATAPPPFLSSEGRFRCLLLEGDAALIAGTIERVFNVPAAGRACYRPMFGKHVLLQTGAFGKIRSQAPGFEQRGYIEETQISLWIPVVAGQLRGRAFLAERLCMAVPYILVDNPMSCAGGREDYGYPKSLGVFAPRSGIGDPQTVEAFGGQFAPDSRAGWQQLLRISRPSGAAAAGNAKAANGGDGDAWQDLGEARRRLGGLTGKRLRKLPELPQPSLLGDLLAALAGKQVRQVFLKQFRDIQGDTGAVYQEVVEAPIHFLSTSINPSLEQWNVDITPLDSHPIGRELGVLSQSTRLTFEVKMDMIAEPGTVIAP